MKTYYNYFQESRTASFVYKKGENNEVSSASKGGSDKPRKGANILDTTKEHIKNNQRMSAQAIVENDAKKMIAIWNELAKAEKESKKMQPATETADNKEVFTPRQEKELQYFLNEKDNPKERYVLYNILKYGLGKSNMQVDQNWSLASLRSQFTEELGNEAGFYYKGNTLVAVHSFDLKRGNLGGDIELDNCSFLAFHSNPDKYFRHCSNANSNYHLRDKNSQWSIKGVADKYLIRFNEHQNDITDTNEIRRKIAEKGLERYVIYRFLENYGFEVDYNWTDQELLDYLDSSFSFSRFFGKHIRDMVYRQNRKTIVENILKEYAVYKGDSSQISYEYIETVINKILKSMRSNRK